MERINPNSQSQETRSYVNLDDLQESLTLLQSNLEIIRQQKFDQEYEVAEKDSQIVLEELRSRISFLDPTDPQLEEINKTIFLAERELKGKAKSVKNERLKQLNSNGPIQIGDDVGIICCHLATNQSASVSPSSEISSPKRKAKSLLIDLDEISLDHLPSLLENQNIEEISLLNCHKPIDALLAKFAKTLKSLLFQNCSSLITKTLEKIPDHFPALETLKITRCSRLYTFEKYGLISSNPLHFPSLRYLFIKESASTKVRLSAPLLKNLTFVRNPKLKQIELKVPLATLIEEKENPFLNLSETVKKMSFDRELTLVPLNRLSYMFFQLYQFIKGERATQIWAKLAQYAWNKNSEEEKKDFALTWFNNPSKLMNEFLQTEHLKVLEEILPSLGVVTALNLMGLGINRKIELLANLPATLTDLDLSYNDINGKQVQKLLSFLSFLPLNFLNLSGNNFKKEDIPGLIDGLANLKSLNKLMLIAMPIEREELANLEKKFKEQNLKLNISF